ncbi:Triacylglycerol lipase 2 [Zea mays]|uniref:Triacylglycerol lipase 2 n=1 Tax=Zea mays TaxID=4577 RepID=A0A1D6LR26_MAIZE|nr:Triacylglycerol lipase 2 [Zea mays]
MAQKDLYLPFLALSIIACCLMNLQTVLSSSSRMRNSTDDISDDKCPPQPHPLESSRRHTTLSPQDPAFWDWTWDQLADYDLPAVLEFVYNRTGGMKVHYVGHSLGTLIILAAFSENRLTDIVRSAALLCPIAYLNSMESRLILLATRIFLAETIHMLGYHEFNPVGWVCRASLLQLLVFVSVLLARKKKNTDYMP